MKRYKRLFLKFTALASVTLMPPWSAWASVCDPDLQRIPTPTGYVQRAFDDRCEGLFQSPASAQLDLVSLTFGPINYDLSQPQILVVSVPTRPASVTSPLHIRSVGIPLGLYYRMDADANPAQPLRWPTKDVLIPAHLVSDRIGIFAFGRGQSGEIIYAPVLLALEGASSAADQTRANVILRPSAPLSSVEWQFVPLDGPASGWQPADLRYGGVRVSLMPFKPGRLQVRWTEVGTSAPRQSSFRIGT
jgi:hypothetical protein